MKRQVASPQSTVSYLVDPGWDLSYQACQFKLSEKGMPCETFIKKNPCERKQAERDTKGQDGHQVQILI